MFQFRDETYLYFLIVIPLCLLVCFLSTWIGKRKLRQLGGRPTLLRLMPQRSLVRQWVKCILLCLALGLLAVCLARPQYGMTERQQTTQGIEAVVMVDVSNSMWADDVQPNRLERAKLLLNNLVDKMENDKIAVGVFAGEAYPQLPITSDYAAAKLCIDALSPEMVTLQGTNIGAAVDLACKSFTDAQGVGRAVILITDGENHEDGALEAVQRAEYEKHARLGREECRDGGLGVYLARAKQPSEKQPPNGGEIERHHIEYQDASNGQQHDDRQRQARYGKDEQSLVFKEGMAPDVLARQNEVAPDMGQLPKQRTIALDPWP